MAFRLVPVIAIARYKSTSRPEWVSFADFVMNLVEGKCKCVLKLVHAESLKKNVEIFL